MSGDDRSTGGDTARGAERIARFLLILYPPIARKRYGAEIVHVVAERVRSCRRLQGRAAALRLMIRESFFLVVSGLRARVASRGESVPGDDSHSSSLSHPPFLSTAEGATTMDLVLHDLRQAVRGFLRRPGFTAVAVGALALGIGANIAIFSVFHAVVLRPLPFENPGRLVAVWEKNPERDWFQAQAAAANFLDWREQAETFTDMAAHNDWLEELTWRVEGEPRVLKGNEVTGNFFRVLGVAPAHGRGFDDGHTWAPGGRAAVLSHGLWQRQFGGDPSVVGRELELDGVGHRILGVMPQGFDYPFPDADLWLNMGWDPEEREQVSFRRAHALRVIGRLAEGATPERAEAELATIAARLEARYPETNTEMGTGITPLREWIVGDTRRPLQILLVAVGCVLLIACANVANMLLARATGRRHEMAVRYAMGGSRGRLVLQGLTEGMLLATVGGALGLALGIFSIEPFLALSPDGLPRLDEVGVDATLVVFSLGVTLLTGLVFGLLPAWRGASVDPTEGWAGSSRGASPDRRSSRASGVLVAAEVTLALPLLIGAGLLVRTLWNFSQVEPGFVAEKVLVAQVSLPASRYPDAEAVTAFYRELLGSVRALPGVEAAALSSRLPFRNQRWSSDFTAEGWSADRYGVEVRHDEISPGLFETLQVPLIRGRDFEERDRLDSTGVVLVNQALAELYFPDQNPIGRRVVFDRVPPEEPYWRTIVGVVGNVRRESLALEEQPSFYAPVLQSPTRSQYLQVRTQGVPRRLVEGIRRRVHGLDPALPLIDVTTLEEVTAASMARERFLLALLAAFAGVATLLAAVGIFGVTYYSTIRRVREIGVRVALGARLRSVVGLVFRRGLTPVVAGLVAGSLLATVVVRGMSVVLFEVQPVDPLTYGGAAVILLLAGVLACVPPARWAGRVDVVSALHTD